MNPYIFGINVIRECFKLVHVATPFPIYKISQKWYFGRQTLGATDLKLGIHTQLDSGSNTGQGPTWQNLFLLVCKAKNAKNGTLEEHMDLEGTHKKKTVLSTSIWPHPSLCLHQARKAKNSTSAQ